MNVHVSYRVAKTPSVEKDFQHQTEKLQKRLQAYRPELVHLKASVEENSPRQGVTVSLNLRLPSGQMAVQKKADNADAAIRAAFEDLLQQVKKHKDLLRASHRWHRRRAPGPEKNPPQVPFEQTLAAVDLPKISAEDVRSYVNANLSKLERFVEREIFFRESQDQMPPDTVSKEEVIDETIATALTEGQEKPERLTLEPWLYRLALQALDELSRPDENDGNAVHLEDSARRPNVRGSDEPALQFHQPDESMTGETVIADGRIATPEAIIASDEIMRLIASSLRDVGSCAREAFILYAIEGFTVNEIAGITGGDSQSVLKSISVAREHLRKAPALVREFAGKLMPSGAA